MQTARSIAYAMLRVIRGTLRSPNLYDCFLITETFQGVSLRTDSVPGGAFPDDELSDHTAKRRKLSELQGQDPMILVLSLGAYCPKDRRQHEGLAELHREIEVGYCRLVTISTDSLSQTKEYRDGVDAHWPFLSDAGRTVQKDLDIAECTDTVHDPMLPHTIVLGPGLVVNNIFTGYWFFGRPTVEAIRRDLHAVSKKCRPPYSIGSPPSRFLHSLSVRILTARTPSDTYNERAHGNRESAPSRPPAPRFVLETAVKKVRLAEDAWNSGNPKAVAAAYTMDSAWRNRSEFAHGRDEIEAFLTRKWNSKHDYRLIEELWAFGDDRIAVRFATEWGHASGQWFRSYKNEN